MFIPYGEKIDNVDVSIDIYPLRGNFNSFTAMGIRQ